jgi:hypothetical protein
LELAQFFQVLLALHFFRAFKFRVVAHNSSSG